MWSDFKQIVLLLWDMFKISCRCACAGVKLLVAKVRNKLTNRK